MGTYIGPHDSNSLDIFSKSGNYVYTEYSKQNKDKYYVPRGLEATIPNVYDLNSDTHHKHHISTTQYSYYEQFSGVGLVIDGFGQGYSEKVFKLAPGSIDTVYSGNPGCSLGNLWNILGITYFDYPMMENNGKAGTLMALAAIGKTLPKTLVNLEEAYNMLGFDFLTQDPHGQHPYFIDAESVKRHFGEFSGGSLADLCATLQEFTNLKVHALISEYVTSGDTIMFAGGVAHNVVLIKYLEDSLGINIFTGFAQGDEGIALGDHLFTKHIVEGTPYNPKGFRQPYSEVQEEPALPYSDILNDLECYGITAIYNGSPEIGNRALGHRSFIANPQYPAIKGKLDRLKRREGFRPYGVMIHQEECLDWLEAEIESPYMNKLGVPNEAFKNKFPTLVHRDGTVRVQIITKEMYPEIYNLLEHAKVITGAAVLVNTSLNIDTPMLYKNDSNSVLKMVDRGLIASCYINGKRYSND